MYIRDFGEDESEDLCCRLNFVSEKERGKGGDGERDESTAFVVRIELLGFFIFNRWMVLECRDSLV